MPITTSFITDDDVLQYMPDILDFGQQSFNAQHLKASDDVYEKIFTEWWPNAIIRRYGLTKYRMDILWPTLPTMDVAFLNIPAIKQLTCYRSIGHYIMPMLASNASNNDFFMNRATMYQKFYIEEWQKVQRLSLYDFDKDGQFLNIERAGPIHRKVVRA